MFQTKTINHHAGLVNRMAETLYIDLTRKLSTGELRADTWRDAVLRCTGCSDPEGCQQFLAGHFETGADAAPSYCRNASLFETLTAE